MKRPLRLSGIAVAGIAFLSGVMAGCGSSTTGGPGPTPPPPPPPPPPPATSVAFENVNVVSMTEESVLADHTVLIEGEEIVEVGPSDRVTVPADAVRIDGTGRYLMPGLADMHIHLIAEGDLLALVANGVTTILNMGEIFDEDVLGWRARIRLGNLLGPTIYAGAFVRGPSEPGRDDQKVANAAEARAYVQEAAGRGYEFMKVRNQVSEESFLALIDEAPRHGVSVIGHARGAVGATEAVEAGQVMLAHAEEFFWTDFATTIDHAPVQAAIDQVLQAGAWITPTLAAHESIATMWCADHAGFADLMAREGVEFVLPALINGPWTRQLITSYNCPSWWPQSSWFPVFDFQAEYTKRFYDAGVRLILGTDAPYVAGLPAGFGIHDEMRLLAETGMTPFEVLELATKNPGEFIGTYVADAEPFGTVEVGSRADLLLLEANPLDALANLTLRVGVLVRGEWLEEVELRGMLDDLARSYGN